MTALLLTLMLGTGEQPLPETDVQCGAYCLYCSLKSLDLPVESLAEVQSRLGPPTPEGYALGKLEEVARAYGANTLGVQTTLDHLRARDERYACIAHVDGRHFVCIADVRDDGVQVVDPPREYVLPPSILAARWDGTALLLSRTDLTPENLVLSRSKWWWFAGGAAILAALALALLARRHRVRE